MPDQLAVILSSVVIVLFTVSTFFLVQTLKKLDEFPGFKAELRGVVEKFKELVSDFKSVVSVIANIEKDVIVNKQDIEHLKDVNDTLRERTHKHANEIQVLKSKVEILEKLNE